MWGSWMLLSCPDRGDVTKAGLLCLPYWSLSLGSNAPPLTFGSPNAGRLSRAGDSFILSASQCADRHPVKGATSVSPAPAGPPGSFTQTGPSVRQRSHSQESVAGNWAQPRVSHLYEKAEAAEVRPHGGTEMLPSSSPASPGSSQPADTDQVSSSWAEDVGLASQAESWGLSRSSISSQSNIDQALPSGASFPNIEIRSSNRELSGAALY